MIKLDKKFGRVPKGNYRLATKYQGKWGLQLRTASESD